MQKQNFGPQDVRFFLLYPTFPKCSRKLFPHWDASFLLKYWSFANAAVNIPYTRMPVSRLLFPSLQTFMAPGAVFFAICPSFAKCRNNEHYWHWVASFLLHYLSFPKNSANSAEISTHFYFYIVSSFAKWSCKPLGTGMPVCFYTTPFLQSSTPNLHSMRVPGQLPLTRDQVLHLKPLLYNQMMFIPPWTQQFFLPIYWFQAFLPVVFLQQCLTFEQSFLLPGDAFFGDLPSVGSTTSPL